jgi:glutamyl-tRNA reductase
VQENIARRAGEIAKAERIVSEEVDRFAGWYRSLEAVPTLVALRRRFEAIRQAELDRLDFKLSALGPDARTRVEEVTRLLVEKLLLTPTEQLKALRDAETVGQYSETLSRLFDLDSARTGEEGRPHSEQDRPRASANDGRVEPFARRKTRAPH